MPYQQFFWWMGTTEGEWAIVLINCRIDKYFIYIVYMRCLSLSGSVWVVRTKVQFCGLPCFGLRYMDIFVVCLQ